jgi:uncharacterized protein (TIGR02145 family)
MIMKNQTFIYIIATLLLITWIISCRKEETKSFVGDDGISNAVFNATKTYETMTDQNGNIYKTITIGTQTWMAENLHVTNYRNGDPIPLVTNSASWIALTTGAYCNYANTIDQDKIATHGSLYNWYTVADARNIAPIGWHVPTDAEWTTLTTYLGGESIACGIMKETGTTHWLSPNTSATNESGFTALPSGYRDYGGGAFDGLGKDGSWWSSTATGATSAWFRNLYYLNATCYRGDGRKQFGLTVRLVKD